MLTSFFRARYRLIQEGYIEFRQLGLSRKDFQEGPDVFDRLMQKDNVALITLFENIKTGTRFLIANTHLDWDPTLSDVKLVQAGLLVEQVEIFANQFATLPPRLLSPPPGESPSTAPRALGPTYTDGSQIPVIIAGDFNSVPESGVYEFLNNGSVPYNHRDFMTHLYGRYTQPGEGNGLKHRLGLKSAYAASPSGELSLTNYVPSYQGALDYLWYSGATIAVNAVLGEVDPRYLEKVVGFPNAHFPSECVTFLLRFCGMC